MERMLDFRAYTAFKCLNFSCMRPSVFFGSVLRLERFIASCHATYFLTFSVRFSPPLITGVTRLCNLAAVERRRRLHHIEQVVGFANRCVHQT